MNTEIYTYESTVRKYFRRNYWAHSIEGGLYMGGLAFVSMETVLPPLVESLGGAPWLISLSPILTYVGLYLPSVFVVHHLERMRRAFPLLLLSGLLQRLPMLFAAFCLIRLVEDFPLFTLYAVAFAPFLSGFFCGVTYPSWVELVAKTIPAGRRASLFAVRMAVASAIGLIAGTVIESVLSEHPGAYGFGILHLWGFAFLAASFIIFSMIKETHMPIRKADKNNSSLSGSILEIPRIFKKDRRFLFYMLSLTFLNGIYFALPFLSVHALKVLDKPGSFLGALVLAMICGQFISNFICGYLGDRYGGKLGFSITFILYLLAFTISAFATSSWLFLLIFFILGFCKDSTFVCRATLNAEIPPLERRVKYQSVINLILLPGIIVIPLCGSFLWNDGKGIAPVCALSVLSIAIGLFFLRKVREPRFS